MSNGAVTTSMAGDRSGRREQNKAENRAALMKAARTVFAEIGYGAAGVRDIVRRTDLAAGTFYNYFKDKEEIFAAVIQEMSVEIMKRHRQARARARTTEEFLRGHISVYMNFVAEDPETLAFGRNNIAPIRMLMEKQDLKIMSQQLYDDMTAAVTQGILPDVDVAYFAAALSGAVFEASVAMVSRDPVKPDDAIDFVTKLMMGGVDKLPRRRPNS